MSNVQTSEKHSTKKEGFANFLSEMTLLTLLDLIGRRIDALATSPATPFIKKTKKEKGDG